MALNYAKSNTFVTGTTISSAAVNANFDDLVNIFSGLEGLTKTLNNLAVDTTLKCSTQFQSGDGAVGAPGYSYISDTTTGFYRSGSGAVRYAAAGSYVAQLSSAGLIMNAGNINLNSNSTGLLQAGDGLVGGPSLSFAAETTTGFYRIGTGSVGYSGAGTQIFRANSSGLTINSGNLVFNAPGTNGILGSTLGDGAAAGNVGEYITSRVAFTNFPTSTQYGDLTSISLTAGDWIVSVLFTVLANGATISLSTCGISTTSGNSNTGLSDGLNFAQSDFATQNQMSLGISQYRVSISSTTTHFLKYKGTYVTATPQAAGRISATRVR